ncbi:BBP7 family outer membrane beta-barrel protein [Aeoliella sp. ICT_H6.2]|uniref:BBP7 family outer membrane beta-barrel protein n=1 Tax=Aeoliella straminimaris TaxID=2954799 RepID=A0A9X2FDA5_9BACT|nr:BBP7 family outer membrane beta-barrel protein [Aeoliella straminimaris]MCO6046967.1 BBP7 family outer membrane beta-barrel protein [Aeoliella straminimaris]
MIRSRLAGLRTWGAFVLALTGGGSFAVAQTAPNFQAPYSQAGTQYGQQQYGQQQQYSPYRQQPASTPAVQPQVGPYKVTAPPAQAPAQQATQVQRYAPPQQSAPAYVPPQTASAPPQQGYRVAEYQLPNYQAPAPGQRYAMMDETAEAESVPPPPASEAHSAPVQGGGSPTTVSSTADCNCNQGTSGSWEGYVQAPGGSYGCNNSSCYPDCDYGAFGGGGTHKLLGDGACNTGCGRQWFFGAYALFMTRDNPSYSRFAISADEATTYPYYPTQQDVVLSTDNIEPQWQWGAEIRFGSTFGRPVSCDPCGGSAQRPCAWEVVYWGLAEDDESAAIIDSLTDTDRLFSVVNYNGLQFDRDGAAGGTYAAEELPTYFDGIYNPDLATGTVRLLGMRARQNFSVQNVELNFIRFPMGGGTAACPSPLSVNAVCGVRYMKLDDDFQLAAMYSDSSVATDPVDYVGFLPTDDNTIFHDINVDNELVGFQFGGNMNYMVGCKLSLFCDTQMGIYGNSISSNQRVWAGGDGEVYLADGTSAAVVNSDKTDVSFMGELRAGVGYHLSNNCRWTTAYRVIAITGVALSTEQIPTEWSGADYVGIVDSNDSIVLHGLQTGFEWKY